MKCPVKPGARGWLATALVIIAADLIDERTLSESFLEFSRTPSGRVVSACGWGYLTAHMFGVIPPRYDPLHLIFKNAPHRRKVVIVSV